MAKKYWGETILSPQNLGEYWGESPCCPCGVGAYDYRPMYGNIIGAVYFLLYAIKIYSQCNVLN
jgi:hypothetical protein